MGRLFWKFFLFFFLAQLTTALGVSAFVLFNVTNQTPSIDQSPMGQSLIDAAQSTLQLGGIQATKQLLSRWESQRLAHHVYVVDQGEQDLLNRKLDASWLDVAQQSIKSGTQENVAKVTLANQQSYLIFVVSSRPNRPRAGLPPPPGPEEGGRPSYFKRFGHSNALFKALAKFPMKGLLIGTLASALFAAILAWYFSKPIKTLRLAFEHAASGDLNISVADKMGSRKDELSDLGRHFDHMTSRLGAVLQGQTRLLHHVSHELRSPLARIHMALGLALQTPEKAENSLARIELEANRMDKMIGELLELSRFESGMVDLKKEDFLLNELLDMIVEDAAFEASNKRIRIALNAPQTVKISGQQDLMHRAIENVVRNAIKYAPNDSIVNIDCKSHSTSKPIEITITDQGSGVLETELEDIFKPFVRGHSGSQVVGHGVGLAITKQVIEAHGGKVWAANLKPHGFSVTMILPV
ncbi:signal transduction histidine kinase [Methylophilaceae bacterium 11]|nr:signal transduction histidine kinase [Methylophilaceae bacterium 11]